ncbi:unnamed protein product [Mycena citricolor]|uniref:Uncharacterized protein n=1 Tax=Mycena citricolor TaxID=2018698 RepID=A0AAD2H3C5_9AGAR|nr:unnamed protein product [Mycena citricolor]
MCHWMNRARLPDNRDVSDGHIHHDVRDRAAAHRHQSHPQPKNSETRPANYNADMVACGIALDIGYLARRDGFMHQPNAAVFFANVSSPVEVAKVVLYVTATLIGDWFMIYRSYKIWQSSLPIVALPIVLWIGSIVSGYGGAYATHATKQGTELSPVVVWIPTFIALSLATNGYCTILIAYRILRSQFAVRKMNAVNSRMTSLVPEQVVFLESAALYSAELIALLVTHQLEVNVQYVVLDATCSLLGITFSMIILPVTGAKQGSELSGSGRPAAPRIEGVNVSRLVEVTTDNVHQMDSFDRVKVDASA